EMTRAKPVVEAIAQIPQAMETPAIRTILARSRNAGVLLELLPGASDEKFVRLFRKTSRLDLEIASVALTRHTGRASLLRKDDFVPMLKSPNSQYRLLAILMLRMDAGAELLPRRRRRASRPKL